MAQCHEMREKKQRIGSEGHSEARHPRHKGELMTTKKERGSI